MYMEASKLHIIEAVTLMFQTMTVELNVFITYDLIMRQLFVCANDLKEVIQILKIYRE